MKLNKKSIHTKLQYEAVYNFIRMNLNITNLIQQMLNLEKLSNIILNKEDLDLLDTKVDLNYIMNLKMCNDLKICDNYDDRLKKYKEKFNLK